MRTAVLAGLLLFMTPATAWAGGSVAGDSGAGFLEILGLHLLEVATPDVHYEWGDGSNSWSLSWPVAVSLTRLGAAAVEPGEQFLLTATIEPQRNFDHGWRGLLFVRSTFLFESWQPGVAAEAGGLVGEDGHGGFVGGGFVFAGVAEVFTLGTYVRHIWTNEGRRWDVTLDLMVPFPDLLF